MAIHISMIAEPNATVVKVDGRLQADDVEELMNVIQGVRGPMELDLADLHGVDRSAITLLRDLAAMGVALRAASPYVKLLLENSPQQSEHSGNNSAPGDKD